MLKEEKDILKQMLHDYGNEGFIKELSLVIKELSNDQSDLSLKEQAIESAELSDMLMSLRYKLKIGRHNHA
jgi:hypothetical protein